MIRPLTFICLLGAFGSGMYLYSEKHRAILLDRDIAHAIHGTEAARERTGLLRAEWALLNDPGRLQAMADKYLALKTMAPGQFVQLAELSTRLPPVPPPGTAESADAAATDDAPVTPPAGGVLPGAATPRAAMAPGATTPGAEPPGAAPDAPAASSPAVVALAEPVHPAAPIHVAARQAAHAAPRKTAHPAALADRDEPLHGTPLQRGTPLPLAGLPTRARMMSALAHASPSNQARLNAGRPAVVTATPSAIGSGAYVGSALASGSSLPPPVPLQ